jgi:hypothetical protein
METIDRALALLEKSIESKEIDVFLLGAVNLQKGTTRVSYKHSDDLVTYSGGHFLNLIVHIMRQIAELNDLNKKELYNALIDLLDDDLIEN